MAGGGGGNEGTIEKSKIESTCLVELNLVIIQMLSLLGVKGGGRHCLYLIPQLENRTTGRGEKCALREGGEA